MRPWSSYFFQSKHRRWLLTAPWAHPILHTITPTLKGTGLSRMSSARWVPQNAWFRLLELWVTQLLAAIELLFISVSRFKFYHRSRLRHLLCIQIYLWAIDRIRLLFQVMNPQIPRWYGAVVSEIAMHFHFPYLGLFVQLNTASLSFLLLHFW